MMRSVAVPPGVVSGFEHVRRFWQPDFDSYVAKILPGEYYVTRGGEWIVTVLGSCVSACIRDSRTGVGGMNHFMLPEVGREKWDRTDVDLAHRYGSYAMEHMVNDILKLGAERTRLEVKIVGGGRILANMTDIGERNIAFVRDYLEREGLPISGEDVGGFNPRKVYYDVKTGKVRVKKLPAQSRETIANEELGYRRGIDTRQVTGEVELF